MITTISRTGKPIGLDEAKNELRVRSRQFDTQIVILIDRAVRHVEDKAQITLHTTVQRKLTLPDWPREDALRTGMPTWWFPVHQPIRLTFPPWKTTDSVTYFDQDNNSQTVNASNYNTIASDSAPAELEFDENFTFPSLRLRRDAVSVTWSAGSATPDELGLQAAIERLHWLFDKNEERRKESVRLIRNLRNQTFGN